MLDDLRMLHSSASGKGVISANTKADLYVWLGTLLDSDVWLPIPNEPCGPPIAHKTFISDAASLRLSTDKNSVIDLELLQLDSASLAL